MNRIAAASFSRRFPLVPRPRPPCRPLIQRVAELHDRAETANRDDDMAEASAVLNLSALLASDCGLPDVAREWCHRHAALYMRAVPLDTQPALLALEPLVNLARLRIRAGEGAHAAALIDALYQAVAASADTTLDGVDLPAGHLTATPESHREVRKWLWAVFLATTARALASAGRWQDACQQLQRHRGIGRRLLDGRQIAVIAQAATDPVAALALLDDTAPAEPWEGAVGAALIVYCRHQAGRPTEQAVDALAKSWKQLQKSPGLGVFHTRLALAAIDASLAAERPSTDAIAADVVRLATSTADGYTARDILAHDHCANVLTAAQARKLHDVVDACAIGGKPIDPSATRRLSTALAVSESVIRRNLLLAV